MEYSPFFTLPSETLMLIMAQLRLSDLAHLIQTNSCFVKIRDDDYFWYQKISEEYPEYFRYPSCHSGSWQLVYHDLVMGNLRLIPMSSIKREYPLNLFSCYLKYSPWLLYKLWVPRTITSADLYMKLRELCPPSVLGPLSNEHSEVDVGFEFFVLEDKGDPSRGFLFALEEDPITHGLAMKGHVRYRDKGITTIYDKLGEIYVGITYLLKLCPVCSGTRCIWKQDGEPFYIHGWNDTPPFDEEEE